MKNTNPQDGPPRLSRNGSRPNNDIYATPHRKKPQQLPKQNSRSMANVPPLRSFESQLRKVNINDNFQNTISNEFRRMVVTKPYIQAPSSGYIPPIYVESKKEYASPSDEDLKNYCSPRIYPMCYNLKCHVCNSRNKNSHVVLTI